MLFSSIHRWRLGRLNKQLDRAEEIDRENEGVSIGTESMKLLNRLQIGASENRMLYDPPADLLRRALLPVSSVIDSWQVKGRLSFARSDLKQDRLY